MHDDQHGTAIISGAALINALDIVGKEIERIKLVVCGAGAAAIACGIPMSRSTVNFRRTSR